MQIQQANELRLMKEQREREERDKEQRLLEAKQRQEVENLSRKQSEEENLSKLAEKNVVGKYMSDVLKHAKPRYKGDTKYEALKQIYNKFMKLEVTSQSDLMNYFEAFLIVAMQKRTALNFFGRETTTGAYMVKALNTNKELIKIINRIEPSLNLRVGIKYEELAKNLAATAIKENNPLTIAVSLYSQIGKEEDLTVVKRFSR